MKRTKTASYSKNRRMIKWKIPTPATVEEFVKVGKLGLGTDVPIFCGFFCVVFVVVFQVLY